jgi:hypothetical protein
MNCSKVEKVLDKCAVCNGNINTHKDKFFKLSGGRDGLACSVKCYNQYLLKKKDSSASAQASVKKVEPK